MKKKIDMANIVKDQRGVSAIIIVVLILALVISLGLIVSQAGLNELALSLDEDNANKTLHIAEACEEEATFRLKLDSSYTGGSLTFTEGSCSISISGGGSSRTVTISSTVDNETRAITVNVDLEQNVDTTADGIDVTNWEEN